MALLLSPALSHVSCTLTVNALHFWQHFLVMAQLTDLLIALFAMALSLLHSDCKCFTLLPSQFLVMPQLTDLLIALFCNGTFTQFLVMPQLTDLLIALFFAMALSLSPALSHVSCTLTCKCFTLLEMIRFLLTRHTFWQWHDFSRPGSYLALCP
ncbi:hypothetical protein niasHS_008781 [Heterodera schachtii]|uniref:Uncharacterized protein n=1 Tax=Heterodera schachtii TaxID=97005 RepID=A0ABD2J7K8_HETSC